MSTRTLAAANWRAVAFGALAVFSAATRAQGDASAANATRDVVTRFERALQDHDVAAIAALVADDIVVFENGHRNDGWQDFRDNHLVPEMKGPKHPMNRGRQAPRDAADGLGVHQDRAFRRPGEAAQAGARARVCHSRRRA